MGRRRGAHLGKFIRHRHGCRPGNAEHKHKPSAAEFGLSLRQASDSYPTAVKRLAEGGDGGGYMYHNGMVKYV